MSALLEITKKIETFTMKLRDWTDTLPIFSFEVTNIQRRTARKQAIEYAERIRKKIAADLHEQKGEASMGSILRDVLKISTGTDLRGDQRQTSTPSIVISPDGEVTVIRTQTFMGILLDGNEFNASLDKIKEAINQDPIDVETPPNILVKTYLVKIYHFRMKKLPTATFTKA
jgi:hypothetical protein